MDIGPDVPEDLKLWLMGDPPLSSEGIIAAYRLMDDLVHLGPFSPTIGCSNLQRAAQMAAIAALKHSGRNGAFPKTIMSFSGFGQPGSLQDGVEYMLPGHENDTIALWQEDGVKAVGLYAQYVAAGETGLAFSHRPVIAGIAEACLGNTDPDKVNQAIGKWSKRPYVIVYIDDTGDLGTLHLVAE